MVPQFYKNMSIALQVIITAAVDGESPNLDRGELLGRYAAHRNHQSSVVLRHDVQQAHLILRTSNNTSKVMLQSAAVSPGRSRAPESGGASRLRSKNVCLVPQ